MQPVNHIVSVPLNLDKQGSIRNHLFNIMYYVASENLWNQAMSNVYSPVKIIIDNVQIS